MSPVLYRCAVCGRTYPLQERIFRCGCGGFLELQPVSLFDKSKLKLRGRSIWRYREAFGLPDDLVQISMEEGCTPIAEKRFDGFSLQLKMDFMQPSGSFKDRGASVLVSFVSRMGIRDICEDSSGNAGAAVSAYAAAAGLKCTVFVPSYTPESKITQIRMYGAEVVRVPGTRQDANDAAISKSTSSFYASHLWHPFFVMGLQSAAFEIWEDLGETLPAAVIVPVGSGGFLEGMYLGFDSLVRFGYAKKLPKIIGVQASACAPVHIAFVNSRNECADVHTGVTVAEGIAVPRPPRARAVLTALRKSGGYTVAVEDSEILDAARSLSGAGVYVEPTSASTLAAWRKIRSEDRENALLVLTGSGLKATDTYSTFLQGGDAHRSRV
jgi:threonine synthase